MAGVTTYTFSGSQCSSTSGRWSMSDQEADELIESETAAAEKRLDRTREPYSDSYLGDGFQVGTGDDSSYAVIVRDRD